MWSNKKRSQWQPAVLEQGTSLRVLGVLMESIFSKTSGLRKNEVSAATITELNHTAKTGLLASSCIPPFKHALIAVL